MVMPGGQLDARDGRRWRLADAGAVVDATRAAAGDTELAIDFEHQTQHSKQNGQPAPAAGWIRELQARAGTLWARVEWTARALAMLKAREYSLPHPDVLSHARRRRDADGGRRAYELPSLGHAGRGVNRIGVGRGDGIFNLATRRRGRRSR